MSDIRIDQAFVEVVTSDFQSVDVRVHAANAEVIFSDNETISDLRVHAANVEVIMLLRPPRRIAFTNDG